MANFRVWVRVAAVLLLVGFAAGCGSSSDQYRQQAKEKVEGNVKQEKQEVQKKVEAKGQHVGQAVKEKVEAGQENLQKEVGDLDKKLEARAARCT
jgi:gas vesicle protein